MLLRLKKYIHLYLDFRDNEINCNVLQFGLLADRYSLSHEYYIYGIVAENKSY